ncbi:rubredoxin [Hymenobacter cellulosivorans]|uniref:Rubredoxin n=1 Tax=Hymenobacter cellulosivorans TaxID=2932249 RepID=A0ABY4F6H4_9BACT|nr:rubredoxin [Hymenobacter cellulosivorans]UOQ51965.1 rubredoxin [Hymenobacter cellulosivorans]
MKAAEASPRVVAVNLPGGIVPAGDLLAVLAAAEAAGIEQVQLGHRQQLLLTVEPARRRALLQALAAAGVLAEPDPEAHPNIVSSYVGEDVFYSAAWLREGVYKDILDGFDYRPRLKINLVDSRQTFVPFFTGHLNFIAAETSNYWQLHVRFPRTGHLYAWPRLVYSEDIPALSAAVERVLLAEPAPLPDLTTAGERLYEQVSAGLPLGTRMAAEALTLPPFMLPYYEGFNRSGQQLWLGIYRRNEQFSVAFLQDVCRVCLQTRVGQLCTTPWKSLVVKGIAPADRSQWDAVLCRHRINVRHAANELNWQVEDTCPLGLALKHELVRYLNEEDVRTYQLCFAIKTRPQTGLFGSIIIRLSTGLRPGAEHYEILHTRDFNPNSRDFVSFRQQVRRDLLGWYLSELCQQFYAQAETETLERAEELPAHLAAESTNPAAALPRCRHCLTVYDAAYGDPAQGVAPGTAWADVPDYHCPTCEAPATEFAFWEEPVAVGMSLGRAAAT